MNIRMFNFGEVDACLCDVAVVVSKISDSRLPPFIVTHLKLKVVPKLKGGAKVDPFDSRGSWFVYFMKKLCIQVN